MMSLNPNNCDAGAVADRILATSIMILGSEPSGLLRLFLNTMHLLCLSQIMKSVAI